MSVSIQGLVAAAPTKRQPGFEMRINTWSTVAGASVWVVCVALAQWGPLHLQLLESLFLLAPLVTIPLGLRLVHDTAGQKIPDPVFRLASWIQPLGALLAVASFAFPAGARAGALASAWFAVTACIGLSGLIGIALSSAPWLERICWYAGMVYLPFGGYWFAASRLGLRPDGFQEPIVFLTAVHFHYASFASPILASVAGSAARPATGSRHRLFPAAAYSVMLAPPALALGWALGLPLLRMLAALAMTAGIFFTVAMMFAAMPRLQIPASGMLLAFSSLSVAAGMCLVCVYAVGQFVNQDLITIPQMAISHGVINSLGFTLCGLLAWRIEQGALSNRQAVGGR